MYVENVAVKGHPDHVLAYDVTFVGTALTGEKIKVHICHIGMCDGNKVVKIETITDCGEKVLQGSAEVAESTAVYVFTSQARTGWDGWMHLLAVDSLPIIKIVKDNPMEMTIHFGGIKGQAIRQRCIDMTYDTIGKDGQVKAVPPFDDIHA